MQEDIFSLAYFLNSILGGDPLKGEFPVNSLEFMQIL
jgi:hypothetical protein